jgi:nitronate monooxygenase
MGGVARSELAAAVSSAGGFGFLGMVREPPELIRREINRVRAATMCPCCDPTSSTSISPTVQAAADQRVPIIHAA